MVTRSSPLLRTGPLSMRLIDGLPASLAIHEVPVIDRIYPSVRAPRWQLVAGRFDLVELYREESAFKVLTRGCHRQKGVRFDWEVTVTGAEGRIDVAADGVARHEFPAMRLGLCLLHSPNQIGRQIRGTADGRTTVAVFDQAIAPYPILSGMTSMNISLGDGGSVDLEFGGATFDTEDHRNFSDPGWKTYSPTLAAEPTIHPVGHRIRHTVGISTRAVRPAPTPGHRIPLTRAARSGVEIGPISADSLPHVGASWHSSAALTGRRRAGDRANYARSMVEWNVADGSALLDIAAQACLAEGASADVVAIVPPNCRFDEVVRTLQAHRAVLGRVAIVAASTLTTHAGSAEKLRAAMRRAGLSNPVGGGSLAGYAGLNRMTGEELHELEFVLFGMTPQQHHTDSRAIMDTLDVQPAMVAQARAKAGSRPLVVGPVAFQRRDEDYPDLRLGTPFHGAYLAGTLAGVAEADVVHFRARELDLCSGSDLRDFLMALSRRAHRRRPVRVWSPGVAAVAHEHGSLVANLRPFRRDVEIHGAARQVVALGPFETRLVDLTTGGSR